MKSEQLKAQVKQAIEELAEQIEAGQSEKLKEYLAAMGRFYRYSFRNMVLIWMQCPGARHVAGYRTWQKLGRQVKKGERGIQILAPIVKRRRKQKRDELESLKELDDEEGLRGFRPAYVFDVSQTAGEELPQFARVEGDPSDYLKRLKLLVETLGIELIYGRLRSAEGASGGGKIWLREGLAPAEEFSTLAHELAHELLHQKEERPDSRTVREVEAESVAFVVCRRVGLETGSAASDYIQLYQGDKETLFQSMQRIQKTAATIIDAVKEDTAAGRETINQAKPAYGEAA